MKIAFIQGQFPALSSTFILNQVTGLLDLGHDVRIFAFKNPGEEKIHPDVRAYGLASRVCYFSIPSNRFLRVLKALGLFFRHFHKGPGKLPASLNVFRFGKAALTLDVFYCLLPFLESDFDILHCHFGPMGVFGSYLKDLGVPGRLVTSFYGFDLTSHVREFGDRVYDRLFDRGDLFLPICRYFQEKLVRYGCPEVKIRVHPVGIDLHRYRFRERTLGAGERPFILGVGRLCEKKGFQHALRTLALLVRKHPDVRYVVLGGGPMQKELLELSETLGLGGHVEFAGPVNQEELVGYYEEAHIFLLPSVTARDGDQEGTPTVLLEAQAMGLPVVSTRHSAIPEIVKDGLSGYLVEEADVEGLAGKLDHLLENPGSWAEMGRRGRTYMEERFNIETLNRGLEDFYRELLEQGSR